MVCVVCVRVSGVCVVCCVQSTNCALNASLHACRPSLCYNLASNRRAIPAKRIGVESGSHKSSLSLLLLLLLSTINCVCVCVDEVQSSDVDVCVLFRSGRYGQRCTRHRSSTRRRASHLSRQQQQQHTTRQQQHN
jgi:hypothetical protein